MIARDYFSAYREWTATLDDPTAQFCELEGRVSRLLFSRLLRSRGIGVMLVENRKFAVQHKPKNAEKGDIVIHGRRGDPTVSFPCHKFPCHKFLCHKFLCHKFLWHKFLCHNSLCDNFLCQTHRNGQKNVGQKNVRQENFACTRVGQSVIQLVKLRKPKN